MPVDIIWNLIN